MAMKLHFEPNLDYQLQAIEAVCDLFRGQETCPTEFAVTRSRSRGMEDMYDTTLGIGNRLALLDDEILANLNSVQLRNGLAESGTLASCDFTVEREPGTGKTFVYLRTVFELNKRFGFTKFVIDGNVVALRVDENVSGAALAGFLSALSLAKQARNTLYELYQGWIDTVRALQTACLLGDFTLPRSRENADARSEALLEFARLDSEMVSLRAAAAREKQVPRQVEFNLQLKHLAEAHAAARARM